MIAQANAPPTAEDRISPATDSPALPERLNRGRYGARQRGELDLAKDAGGPDTILSRVEAPQRLGRKRKDSGSGYWTVSESFAVRERLPEAPVMVTVYWPAVVPIGGGGTVLPPPPPQFATPMSRSRTAAASVAPADPQ